jgi:NitT/TauT family transport system ATP-binding protein
MIELNNIVKKFGDITVFDGLSDVFEAGRVHCLSAPSGSGKTTLLKLLGGMLSLDGGVITDAPKTVSFVFQEERLIPQKTAYQNLLFVLKEPYEKKARFELERDIAEWLKSAELQDAKDLYPHEMSGGMKRRLALVRAFLYPSDALFLDEPFHSLDQKLKDEMIGLFLDFAEKTKKTVLLVSHDKEEINAVGDVLHVYSEKPMKLLERVELKRSVF